MSILAQNLLFMLMAYALSAAVPTIVVVIALMNSNSPRTLSRGEDMRSLLPLAGVVVFAAAAGLVLLAPWWRRFSLIQSWFRAKQDECRRREVPSFVVDLDLDPPLVKDFWRKFDNADDVGLLRFEGDALVYEGDAVEFRIARDNVILAMAGTTVHKGLGKFGKVHCLQLRRAVDGYYRLSFTLREGKLLTRFIERRRELERWVAAFAPEEREGLSGV